MSSETPSRFRLTVAVTLSVLLVAAVGLGAVSATRGPRLKSGSIDVTAAVSQPGQPLVIRTDHVLQPLATEDVTITPAAPFRVQSDGVEAVIVFDGMLHYRTPYEVTVRARSAGTGSTSVLGFAFTTPDGQIFTLERAAPDAPAGEEDLVQRRLLGSDDFDIAYQAPRIQEYAAADPRVAVITSDPEGIGVLTVATLDGSAPARTVAKGSVLTQVRASGPDGVFGYLSAAQRGTDRGPNQLLILDPAKSDAAVPVKGLDGKPLVVNNWRFVPGTRSVVAQDADSAIYLIDPLGTGTVTPLGAHTVLHGFAPTSTTLVVETDNRFTGIDLATGRSTALPQERLPAETQLYSLIPVSEREQIRLIAEPSGESTRFRVERVRAGETELVHDTGDTGNWVQNVCVSPNLQFVAIETTPEGAVVDDDSERPGFHPTTTVVIELDTKRVVNEVPGFRLDWCQ